MRAASKHNLARLLLHLIACKGCDAAIRAVGLTASAGVRLEGTTLEPGLNILHKSGPNMIAADKATKEGRQWHRRRETDNKGPAK